MGNSNTDSYFTEKPNLAVAAFRRSYTYFWLDAKVNLTSQNKFYQQILREFIQITPVEKWEALASNVEALSYHQSKVCLISSSSQPPQAYSWMQTERKIERVILFCSSEEHGEQLKESYSKIMNCFTNFVDVIGVIRQLEAVDIQAIFFFCEEEMGRLNQWMHNWFTLQQVVVRERGKEDFRQFMNALMPGSTDVKKFEKNYDLSKSEAERQKMVLEWIEAQNFFLQIPTQMLAKLRDIFSLALIRQPFFDIYNTLKSVYAVKNYAEMTVYAWVSLNARELQRLRAGGFKYIYFSTFLICDFESGRKSLYANEFRVTLQLKERIKDMDFMDCSGFYLDQRSKRIFLNIDNPFEVLQIDLEKRQMLLQLVHVPRIDVQQPAELNNLQLHRRFIRYIAKIIPGQLLSSYHNQQLPLYRDFVKIELAFLQEATNVDISNRRLLRKVEMAKVKLYFHLEAEEVIQREVLEAKEFCNKISIHNGPINAKIKIYLLLIEINLRANDYIKFGKCLARLKQIFEQVPQNFSEEESSKLKLYSIYAYIATNKTEIEENLEKVKQIQTNSNIKMREDSRVSELYFLIMLTKIKCQELMGNFKKACSLFDELITTVKTCQGENEVYLYFEHLKLELQLRERKMLNEQEKEQKKKRLTSQVPLQLLLCDPYAIDFSIDSQLFKLEDDSQYFN